MSSTNFNTLLEKTKQPQPAECKGIVFRFVRDQWIGSDLDVNFRDRFRHQARLSCPGCDKCEFIWIDLQETIDNSYKRDHITYPNSPTPGKLYTLKVTNISTDWETGYVDDWDIGFEEIQDV